MNNNTDYLYKWYFSPELSFQSYAKDIEIAKTNIVNDVIALCIEHENIYQYFKLSSNKSNRIQENIIRYKLSSILCLAYDISTSVANDNIDECYDYLNYKPVHDAIKKILNNVEPIILHR